jgi:hypothetical protein
MEGGNKYKICSKEKPNLVWDVEGGSKKAGAKIYL